MLRADQLIVVHHDDTVSRFADVRYTLGRRGLLVIDTDGAETLIAAHDILMTHATRAHPAFESAQCALAA